MTLDALGHLTKRQREAVECRYGRDLPEPDTASRMAVSPRRVRYLLSGARRRLSLAGVQLPPLPVGRPRSALERRVAPDFDKI